MISQNNNYFIKVRRIRWARHVERTGVRRAADKDFVGKQGGKRLRGRPKRRLDDGIGKDLKQIG